MPSKPDRPVGSYLLVINMMSSVMVFFSCFLRPSPPSLPLPPFFFNSVFISFFLSLYSSAIFHFHVSIYKKGSFKTIYVFIKISLMANDIIIELLFKQTSHFVIEISSLFSLVKGIILERIFEYYPLRKGV